MMSVPASIAAGLGGGEEEEEERQIFSARRLLRVGRSSMEMAGCIRQAKTYHA